eukprot:5680531-Alexandrium_andersonii.AAC.1
MSLTCRPNARWRCRARGGRRRRHEGEAAPEAGRRAKRHHNKDNRCKRGAAASHPDYSTLH